MNKRLPVSIAAALMLSACTQDKPTAQQKAADAGYPPPLTYPVTIACGQIDNQPLPASPVYKASLPGEAILGSLIGPAPIHVLLTRTNTHKPPLYLRTVDRLERPLDALPLYQSSCGVGEGYSATEKLTITQDLAIVIHDEFVSWHTGEDAQPDSSQRTSEQRSYRYQVDKRGFIWRADQPIDFAALTDVVSGDLPAQLLTDWIKLAQIEGRQVLYEACDASNPHIALEQEDGGLYLIEGDGQTAARYAIKAVKHSGGGRYLFNALDDSQIPNYRLVYEFSFSTTDKSRGRWFIRDSENAKTYEYIAQTAAANVPLVKEPCEVMP